ncbi:MAG: nuclear transport factor 2 family protein [Blastocatellia bacterium]|nr:nuclear transport factor 2 family protein [Blastocatellia bacterium]
MEQERLIEKEIFDLENEIFAAIKCKDPNKLDEILSEDFVYRNPLEGEHSKADFLAAIRSLPVKILSVWSEDLKITIIREVVVASGTQKAKTRTEEGDEKLSTTAFVDIFFRQQEKWKLARAYGVALPSTTDTQGKPQPRTV